MAHYVDGFVIPLPKDRVEEYRKVAEQAAVVWKDYGALDYWECIGDDLAAPEGCSTSFKDMTEAGEDETVVFAWVVWASREARDEGNAKIFTDPRMSQMMDPDAPLFDMKRMAYGGFTELVHG